MLRFIELLDLHKLEETEEYAFSESQTGVTIIRFENIRDSGLDTEFGLVVVPEFGIFVLVTLVLAVSAMILLSKNGLGLNRFK